jgi:hypothetical protein
MKFLVLGLVMISTSAFAQYGQYNAIKDCGSGSFVIDQKIELESAGRGRPTIEKKYYQIVLRNADVIADFKFKNAVNSNQLNAKGELVREVVKNESGQFYSFYDREVVYTVDVFDGAVSFKAFKRQSGEFLADFYFNSCK